MPQTQRRIAIQHFRIAWTKDERGAEYGTIRNAMPRDYPFVPPGECDQGWLQRINRDLRHPDEVRSEWVDLTGLDKFMLPVFLRHDGDFLWLKLNTSSKIRRGNEGDWIVRLPFGQKVVIDINQAHDGDHQRLYRDNRITVGYAEQASLELPQFRYIDLRELLY